MSLDSTEERLYDQVASELRRGEVRDGLWLKATVESSGDEFRAKSLYTKYRIAQLKEDADTAREAPYRHQMQIQEQFVRVLRDYNCSVLEQDGAWILYLPSGDTQRFSSFSDCQQFCESFLGIVAQPS